MPPIVSTDRWQQKLLGGEFIMICISSCTYLLGGYHCNRLLPAPFRSLQLSSIHHIIVPLSFLYFVPTSV